MSGDDERFMIRALELARRAPFTSPNPRVGAVVVKDGRIVGEGWHEGAGRPHAEARALAGVDARGGTLYVTLEPCTHFSRTPPCARALVEAGIRRAVISLEDPDRRVDGRGIDYLRSRGVEVETGVLREEVRALNLAYLHHRRSGRPLLSVKLALSLDGRMAAPDGSSRWISGEGARRRAHARRAEVDAILVGAGTVLADDPRLTARGVAAGRQPARVVVDAAGRVPARAAVFGPGGETIVATTAACEHEVQTAWKEAGAEVLILPAAAAGVDLRALAYALGGRGFLEVYCEGGGRLAASLLKEGLVDRLEIHRGPVLLGRGGAELGDLGVSAMSDAPRWRLQEVARDGDDVLTVYSRSES